MNYDISTKDGLNNSVIWTQRMFSMIKDGGTWAIPRSGAIVRVDHSNNTAHITLAGKSEPDVERVIKAMGWNVVYK
jgi:hypothetical protein